jgi:hypothetical protein
MASTCMFELASGTSGPPGKVKGGTVVAPGVDYALRSTEGAASGAPATANAGPSPLKGIRDDRWQKGIRDGGWRKGVRVDRWRKPIRDDRWHRFSIFPQPVKQFWLCGGYGTAKGRALTNRRSSRTNSGNPVSLRFAGRVYSANPSRRMLKCLVRMKACKSS